MSSLDTSLNIFLLCCAGEKGITVSKQSQVMAQVTYQALFRSFPKLCGMTGTAATDANELEGTYGLVVVQVGGKRGRGGSWRGMLALRKSREILCFWRVRDFIVKDSRLSREVSERMLFGNVLRLDHIRVLSCQRCMYPRFWELLHCRGVRTCVFVFVCVMGGGSGMDQAYVLALR